MAERWRWHNLVKALLLEAETEVVCAQKGLIVRFGEAN
jgi:hypothetical protein